MKTLNRLTCFGPSIEDDGVHFRIWAPAAESVAVVVENGPTQAMQRVQSGYYETTVANLGVGALYQFRINGTQLVADPGSRFQPMHVEGPSQVVDLSNYTWKTANWQGRPWYETVIYEVHVGTFTPEGTYTAAIERLDGLVELGITAIEIMPLAETPGGHNWGYDGVLLYAPEAMYGRPEELQAFVDAAHGRGLMVFLDVVYNHFGPQGNYLSLYAPDFFTDQHQTPWGAAIDLCGPDQEPVRSFFIENALLWVEQYRFDGLRFDAAHELRDHAIPGFLDTLAETIRRRTGSERYVHLILENEESNVRLLSRHRPGEPQRYDAQWNDDMHHALHVVATGETYDYYADYAADPVGKLMQSLSENLVYQGEYSQFRKRHRGGPSSEIPPVSFINFLQNHDQVGNRALGERFGMLVRPRVLTACIALVLLSPMVPMMFMGEEWNASTPFLYFCDFEPGLAKLVSEGRRRDFAGFPEFANQDLSAIPDPIAPETFERSRLNWQEREQPEHQVWLALYQQLLLIRRREIVPRLAGMGPHSGSAERLTERAFVIRQRLGDGSLLTILANVGEEPIPSSPTSPGTLLFATDDGVGELLPPWSVRVHVELGERVA